MSPFVLLTGASLLLGQARAQDLPALALRGLGGAPIGAGDLDWDDDGDCFCEVGPCAGGVRPECGQILDGDCLDNPSDDRSNDANPGREESCDDVLDNDCNGFVNDGCTSPARYASVQGGGGCSAAPRPLALPSLLLAALALATSRARRRS
ncbi:MAG: hypothetical protein ABIO70_19895 [Pseudomonadota bacterium]